MLRRSAASRVEQMPIDADSRTLNPIESGATKTPATHTHHAFGPFCLLPTNSIAKVASKVRVCRGVQLTSKP